MKIEDDAVLQAIQALAALVLRDQKDMAGEMFGMLLEEQRKQIEGMLGLTPNMTYWYDGNKMRPMPRLKPFATKEGYFPNDGFTQFVRWEDDGGVVAKED